MSEKNIGALWKKTNEKGEFYTGVLENEDGSKKKIVVFKNGYKQKDTQPDFLILKAKEIQKDFSMDDIGIVKNDDDLPF